MNIIAYLLSIALLADAARPRPSDQEVQLVFHENRPVFEQTICMMKDSGNHLPGNWMNDQHRERLNGIGVIGFSSNIGFTRFVFDIFWKKDDDCRKGERVAIGFGDIDESFVIDSSDCLLCDEWEDIAFGYKLLEDGWWIVRDRYDYSVGVFVLPE